jgi:hypothetical protein
MPWRTSPEWSSPSQGEEHGFKSHPGYCDERVGWAPASPSGCNPPAIAVQVQLLPDTLNGLVAQPAERDSLKVEVQGSTPCGATGRLMGVSSNGKTVGLHPADEGSTPSTVHCSCPGGEADITRLSEGRGPGSTPGRGTDGCPRGVPAARDRAKVEGEVRLLTGILWPNPSGSGTRL